MKAKTAVSLIVAGALALVVLPGAPVGAQDSTQNSVLGVRLVQKAAGGDRIQIFGLLSFSQLSLGVPNPGAVQGTTPTPSSAEDGLNVYSSSFDLVRSVGSDLNVDRDRSSLSEPTDPDGHKYPDTNVEINTHEKLFAASGHSLALNVDTSTLRATARAYGYSKLEVGVCPLSVGAVDESSSGRSDYDIVSGCSWWNQSAAVSGAPAVQIKFVESPNASHYWALVRQLVIATIGLTVLLALGTYLLRRSKLSKLGNANLALIIIGTALAWLSAVIATTVLAYSANSVNDLVLIEGYSEAGLALAVILPGLLFSLPWLVPVLMLATVGPPEYRAKGDANNGGQPVSFATPMAAAGPGVPSWLGPVAPSPTPQTYPAETYPAQTYSPQSPSPQSQWEDQYQDHWQQPPPAPQWWGQPAAAQPPTIEEQLASSEAAPHSEPPIPDPARTEPAPPEPPFPEPPAEQDPPTPESPSTWHPPTWHPPV